MRMAKVFMSGNSQAIRLPKDFQFHSKEVAITKRGNKLIIWEMPENLAKAYHLLTSLPDDFYEEGRIDLPPQERESL
jgi:antitoxin VapB